ncbi:DUF3592 domain-containing protein [Robbsia andropogonis]|uniref:DUF3592 domain-containing protein n=1 Tax=Robbsia andropogonis TaxID=28092 RepID=UPI002A6A5D48|nr:DUF3592 domain-containing protein [Robbsia andropogonis]
MRVKAMIFMVVGAILLGFAIPTVIGTRNFLRTAIAVPGVVISAGPGGVHAEIAFVTKAGEKLSYIQNGEISKMTAGQQVTVLYRPEAPWDRPTIDEFGAIWTGTGALLLIGVGFIFIGWLNYRSKKRTHRG